MEWGIKCSWLSNISFTFWLINKLQFQFCTCVHIVMLLTTQEVMSHYLFRECFVWPEHWVSLCILIQHLSIGPVVLNLRK